jgi:hypothetical protein
LAFGEKYCTLYFIPAIINRDIIYALCTSNTPPPPTPAIFRTFKKSKALYKVHNMGLRYIKVLNVHSNTVSIAHYKQEDPVKKRKEKFQAERRKQAIEERGGEDTEITRKRKERLFYTLSSRYLLFHNTVFRLCW